MVLRKKFIGAVVLFSLLLAFTGPASADCVLLVKQLVDTSCDPENWCWFFWGQLEYLYYSTFDCDDDGIYDYYSFDTVQGDCCSVN